MKKNRAGGSLFWMLLRYFALFIGLFMLLGLAVSEISDMIYSSALGIQSVDMADYQKQLYNESYSKIAFEKIVGKGGYAEVLDESGAVVYSTGVAKLGGYTQRELECISEFSGYATYGGVEAVSLNESNETLVIFYSRAGDEKSRLLIAADKTLVAGEVGGSSDALTDTEFALLTGAYEPDFALTQYSFATKSGVRTIIFHAQMPDDSMYIAASRITDMINIGYIIVGILMFMLMAYVLARKVKKPLALLDAAIENVSTGKAEPVLYKGPSEFTQICDSFNAMSKRLGESEAQRQALEAARQKLLADISHDLKTPVTVIRGYANALTQELVPPEKQKQYLTAIAQKSQNLSELIDSFHEFSKLEHPQFVLDKTRTELCEYLREYLAMKYDEIHLAGLELEPEIPDERIFCQVDKVQFARALDNLVSNSLRHSGAGTTITLVLYKEGASAHITVADNGAGIPLDAVSTIFEPFIKGDDARSAHGSGLGLAIAKKTVVAHGGFIRLITPPQKGFSTQFEIVLPTI